ncbi:MAG: lipoprotein signal peptidase [Sulfurovum sp.]|nr:lipoprotein signal peptidase [Sulfurovum sp.]
MRLLSIFFLAVMGTFIIDQGIKDIFVSGYEWHSKCISLELHYNKGVAFSMFAFLGPYLKWIQSVLIVGIILYLFMSGLIKQYAFPLGLLIGGALGNLYDRFIHEGVVDYIYWHCWFNYPVFNYADIMVIVGVGWIVLATFFENKAK